MTRYLLGLLFGVALYHVGQHMPDLPPHSWWWPSITAFDWGWFGGAMTTFVILYNRIREELPHV